MSFDFRINSHPRFHDHFRHHYGGYPATIDLRGNPIAGLFVFLFIIFVFAIIGLAHNDKAKALKREKYKKNVKMPMIYSQPHNANKNSASGIV
jgi:hypothetical protein